jgi:hypothetical protein
VFLMVEKEILTSGERGERGRKEREKKHGFKF